jgi:hypothetical protein
MSITAEKLEKQRLAQIAQIAEETDAVIRIELAKGPCTPAEEEAWLLPTSMVAHLAAGGYSAAESFAAMTAWRTRRCWQSRDGSTRWGNRHGKRNDTAAELDAAREAAETLAQRVAELEAAGGRTGGEEERRGATG